MLLSTARFSRTRALAADNSQSTYIETDQHFRADWRSAWARAPRFQCGASPMKPPIRRLKITRSRHRPENGGGTVFFKVDMGRLGRFLDPHQVPDFDGEEAWFEI